MSIRFLARRPAYLALLALQLSLLAGCSRTPAEEAIRQSLIDMAAALEARNSATIIEHLDENFRSEGAHGGLDRRGVQRTLMLIFYRHRDISVTLTNIQVEPDPVNRSRASATFNALTTGGDGGLLPTSGELYRVESEWRLVDGEWKLLSISGKRALES